jgi:hypothetical protein
MGWGESVSAISVEKLPETVNSSSLVILCCIDCPLYIVFGCIECVVVSCLVCTLVVVFSVLFLVVLCVLC